MAKRRRGVGDTLGFLGFVALKFQRDRCMQTASSLTTTTLFALVPLVTLSIDIFSLFPEFSRVGHGLHDFLMANMLPSVASRIVNTYMAQFSRHAAQLTWLGLVLLMGAVVSLIVTVDHAFNAIWGKAPRRPWRSRVVVYPMLIILGPLLFGLGLWGMALLVKMSLGWAGEGAHLTHEVVKWSANLVLALVLAIAYYKIPDHPVRLHHALLGGLTGALLFEAMKTLFSLFIGHFTSYTLIYGAFAALPIFLLWVHASWGVILFSAVLTAALPLRAQGLWRRRRP